MKELKLKISNEVYSKLIKLLSIKEMCGNLYGIHDEFIHRIVKAIDDGKKELSLKLKKKEKIRKEKK